MTENDKLSMLKTMTGEADCDVLLTYLALAGNKVLRRAYPGRRDIKDIPDVYAINQVEIAAYLLNKRGAEGETSHSENGISRSYENGNVPETLLMEITPIARVIK